MERKFPRAIAALLRLRFRGVPNYVLGDLMEEYTASDHSTAWLLRQSLSVIFPGSRRQVNYYSPKERHMLFFSTLWSDVRYALRTLRKNPSFTTVAVIAIALGIGVNTGIFTVLDGVALRPLAAPDARNLVSIYQTFTGVHDRNVHGAESLFSLTEYQSYRDGNHVLTGLAAYGPFLNVTLSGDHPHSLYGQFASCNYFDVLNQPPALGRALLASDCAKIGEGAVVVLSNDLWRSEFAADPAIAGKNIIMNRQLFTIVGVAPAGFHGTEPISAAFWTPYTMQPVLEPELKFFATSNTSWLALLGHKKSSVSLSEVRADLGVIAGRIDQLSAGRKTNLSIQTATTLAMPEEKKLVVTVGTLLLAAVGMVLLVACCNVANLLLARAAGRSREISIRLAVGASRGRLIRQLLTESVLISMIGGTLGSLIAIWSFQTIANYIVTHLPHDFPPMLFHIGPDIRVLAYALALTFCTGIVFGLLPALHASRPDLSAAMKDNWAGLSLKAAGGGWLRQVLVGGQIAVSMVLLLAAGLLLRGLLFAQTVNPSFDMNNVTVATFHLRNQGYDDPRAATFHWQLLERLSALPGVVSVAQSLTTPLSDSHHGASFTLTGESRDRMVEVNAVDASYFSLLNIPIVRGRGFTSAEAKDDAPVAIVTESTARSLWPGKDPIGATLRQDVKGPVYSVIGVAQDAQVSHLGRSNETYLYHPLGPKDQIRAKLLIRTAKGVTPPDNAIRAAVRALDADLLVDTAQLEDNLEVWRLPSRIIATLAGTLGAFALILAAVGIYGVVSYGVSCRTREIGIRMSLGAEGRDVVRAILKQAMRPVLIGAVFGIAGAAAVSRLLSAMLFGVSAHDPAVFVGVPLFLLLAALLASYLPARRATQVDPIVALRYE